MLIRHDYKTVNEPWAKWLGGSGAESIAYAVKALTNEHMIVLSGSNYASNQP